MKARIVTLGISLTACVSIAMAQVPAPKPPQDQAAAKQQYEANRKKQDEAAEKKDDIRQFGDQDPITKARILLFRDWDDVKNEGKIHWGYKSESPKHGIGDIDNRTRAERYLHFDHPQVQPRPGQANWRTYLCVKNEDDPSLPKGTVLPVANRPDDETWLNLKTGEPFPEPPPTHYQGQLHFD